MRNKDSVGQLLIVGFDGTEMSPRLASMLTRLQPAGVILFARNIQSPEQTWRLLRECRKCVARLLFTCVDLEGGDVDRFRDALGAAPSAADVVARSNAGVSMTLMFAAGGSVTMCFASTNARSRTRSLCAVARSAFGAG